MSNYVDLLDRNRRLTTHSVVYNTNTGKGIKCDIDDNFDGGWYQENADNAETFMSCTRYVITYAGFTVLWCSKLQI